MSSNIRITKPRMPSIPGTKSATRNAQLLVSTGIPSLDYFIGGGLPIGSILLIEEDAYNVYSKVMLKYFIAEGIVNTHSVFIASQDVSPSLIASELPALDEDCLKTGNTNHQDEKMKIAWRYQNMKLVDSSPGDTSTFGHYYDLTKRITEETLKKADIKLWNADDIKYENSVFSNNAYMDLLVNIKKTIVNGQFLISQANEKRNILRIAINSLGSRLWLSDVEEKTENDLFKFLYFLRSLLRESFTVAILTIPVLNFRDYSNEFVQRIGHLSDVVIGLESFSGSSKETNPIFKDYHGLLHIKKVPAFNTLINQDVLFSDLIFKLRRKKFCIEILHLPPEFGDSAQQEQAHITTSGCGGTLTGHRKLDF